MEAFSLNQLSLEDKEEGLEQSNSTGSSKSKASGRRGQEEAEEGEAR